ncbi:MAG: hypothetical protein Q4F26_05725 [Atopococcus tabaci]|uniref:Uncharacterized protein n=1 Tax=Atopococcus tabaci TaxID=269774 RepID=A0AA43ZS88_9LACT|nr:hypothetical protein [Atopococcus tabaci]
MSYYVDTMRQIAERIDDYLSKRKEKKKVSSKDAKKDQKIKKENNKNDKT